MEARLTVGARPPVAGDQASTSFDVAVLLQTMMKQGGTGICAPFQSANVLS